MLFSGTGFKLIIKSIQDQVKYNVSSDIEIESKIKDQGLPEKNLTAFLNQMKERNIVSDFTFVSLPINQDVVFDDKFHYMSHIGGGQKVKLTIYSI